MKTRQSPAVRTSWPSGNHTSSDAVQRTAEQLELGIGPHTHADCSVLSFGLGAPRDLSKTFWNCLVSMAQENPQRESAGWNLLQLAAQDVSKDPVGFAATSPERVDFKSMDLCRTIIAHHEPSAEVAL
eukprot:scaffold279267_cov12-Tisochrysis_lutea.AAC.1